MRASDGWKLALGIGLLIALVIGTLGLTLVAGQKAKTELEAKGGRFAQGSLQIGEAGAPGMADRRARMAPGGPPGSDLQYIRPGGESAWQPAPPTGSVEHEQQDIKVSIEVIRQEQTKAPRYQLHFAGDYVLRNKADYAFRQTFLFPFPANTDAKWNTEVLVDEKPVEAEFTPGGVTWAMDFKPGERRKVQIAYEARGKQEYVYELSKAGRLPKVNVEISVKGTRGRPELLADTLEPTKEEDQGEQSWRYTWQYDGLVADRDIALRFPDRRVAAAAATVLVRAPWVPLLLTLGFMLWIAVMAHLRGVRMRPVQYVAIAACFLLFAPAVFFFAELVALDWAYVGAAVVIAAMIALYALANVGPSFTAQYVVSALVLFLGTLGVVMLAPWLAKATVVVALLVVVGCLMLATRGPAPEPRAPLPPRAEAPPPPPPAAYPNFGTPPSAVS